MNIISKQVVDQVWREHSKLGFFENEKKIATLSKEQPYVISYLMTSNSDHYDIHEKQSLLYLGVVIWQMMKKGEKSIKTISEKDISLAQKKNIEMFEYLEGEIPGDFEETVKSIFAQYNQKHILKYLLDSLFKEGIPGLRPGSVGFMFFDLKTILDCMDQ